MGGGRGSGWNEDDLQPPVRPGDRGERAPAGVRLPTEPQAVPSRIVTDPYGPPRSVAHASGGLLVGGLGLFMVGFGVFVGIVGVASENGKAIAIGVLLILGGIPFALFGAHIHRSKRANP